MAIMERRERTPGFKLGLAIAIGMLLAIPIFSVWFLVYDRQSQANEARSSIAAGWGGPQAPPSPSRSSTGGTISRRNLTTNRAFL